MRVLYQVFILEESSIEFDISKLIKEQLEVENEFVTTSIDGILKNREEIFKLANQYLTNWPMNRLNKVDQAILSIGIYEAIELSKKYSDEKVTKMINAVLDEVYHADE